MLSFFVHLVTLLRTLVNGFRHDGEFRALAILLLGSLVGGTIFYWRMEHWTVLDSLYFCVMTISTIGYGDFVPTTPVAKVFTILYTILGIGLFATFVGKLVVLRMDNSKKRTKKKNTRRTKRLKNSTL